MNKPVMTSMQRVLTTLSHQEPDRVPLFLLPTLHGARELGLSIKDYFASAENVVRGQLLLRKKYQNDCLDAFFYAPIEVEAWGGEVIYREDGPPNSGEPFIRSLDQIKALEPPRPAETPCLRKVLDAIDLMKKAVQDEVPIIAVVISPFSLPVMQLGFDRYLDLLYEQPAIFWNLMQINIEFCVAWANAQVQAGATAICYFDPLSSPTNIPRDLFIKTGFPIARQVFSRIKSPIVMHLASGSTIGILDDIISLGAAVVGVSAAENLTEIKQLCRNKLTILGNMNGITMRHWTLSEAEDIIKNILRQAGSGGGFILSDNHGEIPYQVADEILLNIAALVRKWGIYPLDWTSV